MQPVLFKTKAAKIGANNTENAVPDFVPAEWSRELALV
jgi:hypothetical protein